MKNFKQTTSFIARLRTILIIIAAFFILGIMSLYLSSQGFLTGLQRLAEANRILNLTSLSYQALGSAEESLAKLDEGKLPTRFLAIREANKISLLYLKEAISVSKSYPNVRKKLEEARQANLDFHDASHVLQKQLIPKIDLTSENARSDILVTRQFLMDTEENVREAQLILKKESDLVFHNIYENRFNPLIVAAILSSAFFGFVVFVGLANARKLGDSLRNLTLATDAVAAGNLRYQAPILESDEFGRLTHEFNVMVSSLGEKQSQLSEAVEKVTRLQAITNSFSGALVPEEVFAVIKEDVFQALKADAGSISLLDAEEKIIHHQLVGYKGVDHAEEGTDLSWKSPMTITVFENRSHFFPDISVLQNEFPKVHHILNENGMVSAAYLPLVSGNQVYGALNFAFRIPHTFLPEEKEFFLAISRHCAQALHRARLFEAAKNAILVRDEFLSIASHELRTPLTPLKLHLQNMSRRVRKGALEIPDKEQVLKIVENSDKQVNRLITLIDDLLDVSRISSGKLTLNKEVFNLSEMTEEVVAHYLSQLREANTLLDIDVEPGISICADRVRIEQVLINLLTNAVKYAPAKPIHVKLEVIDDKVRLQVRDEGEGISPENQKRIFDRFERVRDKNNIGGLGLGLYICRQIVEAHHGVIRVTSEPGQGANFIVEIPLLS